MTATNKDELLPFHNDHFWHPSYQTDKNRFLQGVQQRKHDHLVKIYQHDFPDTAEFGGSLLDPTTTITESTETYCELVLLLFYPYWHLTQIASSGSYTMQLREAISNGMIGERAKTFLQNLQDARSNCLRLTGQEDDLQ
jgi:hypothetical protein